MANSQTKHFVTQVVSPWGAPSANVPVNQAYYKKTDTVSPGAIPVSSPWAPGQQSTTYSSGAAYGTNQWNTSGVDNRGQWNSNSTQWTSGGWNNSGTQAAEGLWNSQSASSWTSGGSLLSGLDDSDMASRDRTQEFARIVRSQQGSLTNGALPHNDGKRTRDLRQYKDFMQRSK